MDDTPRRLERLHRVRTPEYVEFEFLVAGPMSRLLAWLLDSLIAGAGAAALTLAVWLAGFWVPGLALAVSFVIWFLASWAYFVAAEYRLAGQTPGKRALCLRAIQQSGVRLGFYHAALRNLMRAVDHLPLLYLVGGALTIFSASGRRLGDLAAGTVVVRERRRLLPAGIARHEEAAKQLKLDRRGEERIARASVEEREVLLAAALRREELAMPARLSLFKKLSDYVAERFGLTCPEHLSDEKFVLAVAGLLAGGGLR